MLGLDHEISSDVEWLLQSGHTTPETLLDALVPEFYPVVYRLALAWLGDEELARRAARETFVQAVLHVHAYQQELGARAWIFRQAVTACRRATPRQKPPTPTALPQDTGTPPAWDAFGVLPGQLRQAFLLYGLCDLSIPQVAYALNSSESDARRRVQQAWEGLGEHVGQSGEGDSEAPDLEWLQQRYPLPEIPPAELSQVAGWAAGQSMGRSLRRRLTGHARELAFTALAIALAMVVFWYAGSRLSAGEPVEGQAPAGPTPVARRSALFLLQPGESGQEPAGLPGLPAGSLPYPGSPTQPGQAVEIPLEVFSDTLTAATPLPELPSPAAVSRRSDSATIRQRLEESAGLWRTLWLQAESLDYGPAGYLGPPVGSRLQAWVQQPGQSLELVGQLDGQVNQVHLVEGGREYRSAGQAEPLYVNAWREGLPLLQDETLRHLAFPSSAPWMQTGGTFVAVENDKAADRRAVVVDWYHPQTGERQYRLWLDAHTGVVLRMQQYGGGDGLTLLREVLATAASFDPVLPVNLFDPQTAGLQGFAQDEQGTPQRFALSAELVPQLRPALAFSPPPPNLDLARSALVFQFPDDLSASALFSDTQTIQANLFAGGYFLGQVPFGLPWSVTCDRSPDGRLVAFATLPSEQQASGQLAWFDLAEPDRVYYPAPGFSTEALAFSPENLRLALFGRDERGVFGIFLLDLATGALEQILGLADAESLVWSPDGRYLAFLGKEKPGDSESRVMVLNLETHQVIYSEPYIPGQPLPAESPLAAWGVAFPLPATGYACTAPVP